MKRRHFSDAYHFTRAIFIGNHDLFLNFSSKAPEFGAGDFNALEEK